MDTLTSASVCRHARIQIRSTHSTAFIDLTDRVRHLIDAAGLNSGFVNIQTLHTTTGIVVNEHEPLLLVDFQMRLEAVAPNDGPYLHDDPALRTVNLTDAERPNGHSHCRALFLPTSVCLNVTGGTLTLGRWQRVFFVELDGPRDREVSVAMLGEAGR